jgi:3-(3-hydroxy-phenyl)propionate hydroxylase
MPDLDLVTVDGAARVFALLHDVKGVLLNFGTPWALDTSAWADRVQTLDAQI